MRLRLITFTFYYSAASLTVEPMQVYPCRVESGLDDPDNLCHLGHFFGGSSGSHPQTKLSGCDPDITCS